MIFFKHIVQIISFFIAISIFAQQKQPLIIDSDAGSDDYRAIILLSQIKNYDIKALTFSDGTLFPNKGALRAQQLLSCLHLPNIPTGIGKKTMYNKPAWRKFAESIPWSTCYEQKDAVNIEYPNAKEIWKPIFESAQKKSLTIVCLGSLSNVYETLLEKPEYTDKIKLLVWYSSPNYQQSTNYMFHPKAADYVLQLPIPIVLIHSIPDKPLAYTSDFVKTIDEISTNEARQIKHQLTWLKQQIGSIHTQCWDELCALFLANRSLFTLKENNLIPGLQYVVDYDSEQLKSLYIKLLQGKYVAQEGVVFNSFPLDSIYYIEDVNSIRKKVIELYGEEEFKKAVITSEIHNHLGVYSIIGVKMGQRALELLQAPISSLSVTSYAGNNPPLSCLNDGIAVTTGSTPAFANLHIDTTRLMPAATFCYRDKCLTLTLKKAYSEKIEKEIKEAVIKYTISSSEYWKTIRRLAIQYWLELNRAEIFEIE